MLAAVFLCTGAICIAAAVFLALRGPLPALILGASAVMPLGVIASIAAAFVLAPYSRFGAWLDAFVATLNVARVLLLFGMIGFVSILFLLAVQSKT